LTLSWCTGQPLETARVSQHSSDGGRLDDWAEGLVLVHLGVLGEPLGNPMSLVLIQRAIRLELMLEDPLASHHIGPRRLGDLVARAVGHQALYFSIACCQWVP
jgi:hypothetical protein